MSFLWKLGHDMLTTIVGIDPRPAIEELRSFLDDQPCPRCGGIGEHHFVVKSDAAWLGTFGGGS